MRKYLLAAALCGALALTACGQKSGSAETTVADTTTAGTSAAETTAAAIEETAAEATTAAEVEEAAEEATTAAESESEAAEGESRTDDAEAESDGNIVGAGGAGIRIQIENPGVVTGEVTDAGMSTVTVVSEVDGQEYRFSKEDAEIHLEDGLKIGSNVEVVYSGVLEGTDTTGVQVLLIQDNLRKTITGTVVSEGMSAIQIETEDGRQLAFSKELAESNRADSAAEGGKVTLEYTGEIFNGENTEYAFVWKISDAE